MDDRLKRSVGVELSLVTVDLVILTIREGEATVLLVERGAEPFKGRAALPGGRVRSDETLGEGALRELREETDIDGTRLHLEQLGAYGDPGRDVFVRINARRGDGAGQFEVEIPRIQPPADPEESGQS